MNNSDSSQSLKEELETITILFEKLYTKTNEKIAILEKKETEWKIKQDQIDENIRKCPQKVVLNIGGQIFATTKDTLLSKKDSFFYAMLSSGNWLPEDGTYFIDRDPKHFRYLLNYLRNGERPDLSELTRVKLDELKKEANYYCLDDLFENTIVQNNSLTSLSLKMLFKEGSIQTSTVLHNPRKLTISSSGNYGGHLKSYNLTPMTQGIFKWSIKIMEFKSWLGMGVVSSDRVEQKVFDDFSSPFILNHGCNMVSCNGYSWELTNHSNNGFSISSGNEIIIEMDCGKRSLTFTNTSNNLSINMSNVLCPVYPCIVTSGKFSIDFEWISHK